MKNYILQESNTDCGFTCLKIVLCKYYSDQNYLFLKNNNKNNQSFLELKNIANKYDLNLEGVYFEDVNLLYKHPFSIIHLLQNKKNHFVIFISKKRKNVKIFDPVLGLRIISEIDFKRVFKGNALISKKMKSSRLFKKIKIVPYSFKISYMLSLFIDFGFIYLLSFLLKNHYDTLIIISITLGILINAIFKFIIIYSYQNYYDRKYLSRIDQYDYERTKGILSLKSTLTNFIFGKLNSYFFIFTLIIVLLSNGLHYLNLLFINIGILLIRWTYIENLLLILKEKLYFLEIKLKLDKDKHLHYKKIKKFSNLCVFYENLPSFLVLLINFVFLLFSNHFFNYNSSSYIIFSLFTLFSIFRLSSNLISKSRYESLNVKKYISKYLSKYDK